MEEKRNKRMGFEIKLVGKLIRRNMDARFVAAGLEEISGGQGPMLGYIIRHSREQDVFQKDLEKEFQIQRSTATVMLQNMEQKGYIVREPIKGDARLKRIVVTEKAIKADKMIREQVDIFDEELEAGITPEEKEAFFRVLGKLIQNLSRESNS